MSIFTRNQTRQTAAFVSVFTFSKIIHYIHETETLWCDEKIQTFVCWLTTEFRQTNQTPIGGGKVTSLETVAEDGECFVASFHLFPCCCLEQKITVEFGATMLQPPTPSRRHPEYMKTNENKSSRGETEK